MALIPKLERKNEVIESRVDNIDILEASITKVVEVAKDMGKQFFES